jgi:LysR family transcriptional regulator, transcriptional activator for dmlA
MDLLEKMATYVRVVEAGSFSAAAKQLRISGAAVSRQIATLEDELRVQLIRRTTRSMSITPAGRTYYERCLRVLREVDEAQALGRTAATAGMLTVSAPVTFGLACVVPHVSSYMAAHSGVRVDLRLEDRMVDLALEGVDVAVRVGNAVPDRTDIVAHELMSYRRVIVAAPAYLRRHGEPKTPEALAKHDALAWLGDTIDTWTVSGKEREARVQLNAVFRSNAPWALRALAVQGAGIAMLPVWFVEDELDRGTLRLLLPAWETPRVTVRALHRREDRGAARVRAFIDHLRSTYEQHAE